MDCVTENLPRINIMPRAGSLYSWANRPARHLSQHGGADEGASSSVEPHLGGSILANVVLLETCSRARSRRRLQQALPVRARHTLLVLGQAPVAVAPLAPAQHAREAATPPGQRRRAMCRSLGL